MGLEFFRFRLIKKLPERPKERERVLHPIKWEYGKAKRASAFNTDFEMYAAYRRFCRDAIIDGNASDAEKWFIRAANVFDGDSDLFVIFYDFIKGLRSKGEYSMTQEMHLGIVARLLDFYPEHLGFLISKADYYFDNKQYDQAIEEYRKLEVQFPDSLMVLYAMARAYQASGRDTDSSKILKLIEKRYKSVQERLNSGRSHSLDASSMKVIREENENVMRLISGKGKPR